MSISFVESRTHHSQDISGRLKMQDKNMEDEKLKKMIGNARTVSDIRRDMPKTGKNIFKPRVYIAKLRVTFRIL